MCLSTNIAENPLISFNYVNNNGAAFNIFEGAKIFLILFSFFAVVGIMVYVLRNLQKISVFSIFSYSLLCSGIFCNMYERIVLGYVRDFIQLDFIDFPIFNISDVYINISVLMIALMILRNNYFKQNETDN